MSELLERLKTSLADSYALESEIGRGGIFAALFVMAARDGQFDDLDDLDDPPERMLHD